MKWNLRAVVCAQVQSEDAEVYWGSFRKIGCSNVLIVILTASRKTADAGEGQNRFVVNNAYSVKY